MIKIIGKFENLCHIDDKNAEKVTILYIDTCLDNCQILLSDAETLEWWYTYFLSFGSLRYVEHFAEQI